MTYRNDKIIVVSKLGKFITENYGELFKKNGEPYADVAKANDAIERVKKQPLMMKYLSGKHQ